MRRTLVVTSALTAISLAALVALVTAKREILEETSLPQWAQQLLGSSPQCLAPRKHGDGSRYSLPKNATVDQDLLLAVIGRMRESELGRHIIDTVAAQGIKVCHNPAILEAGLYHPGTRLAEIRLFEDALEAWQNGNAGLKRRVLNALEHTAHKELIHGYQFVAQRLDEVRGKVSRREANLMWSPLLEGAAKVAVYVSIGQAIAAGNGQSFEERAEMKIEQNGSMTGFGPYELGQIRVLLNAQKDNPAALTTPAVHENMLLAFALDGGADYYLLRGGLELVDLSQRHGRKTPLSQLLPADGKAQLTFADYQRMTTLPNSKVSYGTAEGFTQFRETLEQRLSLLTVEHLVAYQSRKQSGLLGQVSLPATGQVVPPPSPESFRGGGSNRIGAVCNHPTLDEEHARVMGQLPTLTENMRYVLGLLRSSAGETGLYARLKPHYPRLTEQTAKELATNARHLAEGLSGIVSLLSHPDFVKHDKVEALRLANMAKNQMVHAGEIANFLDPELRLRGGYSMSQWSPDWCRLQRPTAN